MMLEGTLPDTAPLMDNSYSGRNWCQWQGVIDTSAGPIDVHYATSGERAAPRRALIVLPGKERAADRYCAQWLQAASGHDLLIAVPAFDKKRFPTWRDYNLGGMLDRRNAPRPRARWLFPALDEIQSEMRQRFEVDRVDLFGHSAGAQLLFRYAMFANALPASNEIIVANAGWYTVPSLSEPFPYGLAGAPVDVDLKALFSRRLTLLAGGRDKDGDHHTLRRDAGARRQGPHRLARALHCLEHACVTASALACPLRWRMRIAPGAAHSNADMAPAALDLLFDQAIDGMV